MRATTSTEQQLGDFRGLDTWEDARILDALVVGQERAIAAVKRVLPVISQAATEIATRLSAGGRLYYAGAGTSIRIGVQDGSELPATFGMAEDRIGYLIAGGRPAVFETLADAEDDAVAGQQAAAALTAGDCLIAIAASGTTAYTIAAAKQARANGSLVTSVVNNPGSPLGAVGHIEIVLETGAEVIAGSTRLGAGTAQKAALNLLSTLTHVKLGAVHDGMMVNVLAGNAKLRQRAAKIIMAIANVNADHAEATLLTAQGHVKLAVLLCLGAKTHDAAQQLLAAANENLRLAMAQLAAHTSR